MKKSGVVDGLLAVADLLQKADRGRFDRDLFASRPVERRPRRRSRTSGFLGFSASVRQLPADTLAAEVAALAVPRPIGCDGWSGTLAVSRTSIMLGADARDRCG